MLPLIPFIAGVAAGVFAAGALRRSDVQDGLRRAGRAMRDAADVSVQRVRCSSAQWRERWSRMDEGDADAEDIELIDAAGDEPDADAPRRHTRRGARRRRREEAQSALSGFDAEDSASDEGGAPAGEDDGERA